MREWIRSWRVHGLDEVELYKGSHVLRTVPRHFHEHYQFCLILEGSGELFYRGARHPNPARSLFVVHPGEVHSNRATSPDGCSYRSLNAAPDLLARANAEAGRGEQTLPFFPSPVVLDEELLRRFLRLHALLERPGTRLAAEAVLLKVLVRLIARRAQDAPTPADPGREPTAVARARDYLETHSAQNVSLAELAHVANLSPYYLCRVFRRTYGLPPHAYLTQRRLAHACRLLRRGEPPAAVAAATGFTDQSHLHRHFKNVLGLTPGAYRAGKNVQDPSPGPRLVSRP
ncbi:MAG: helix-turn-helix domain-containing protein [Myxococcota bacterium]